METNKPSYRVNEAHLISFVMDFNPEKSAVTIIDALPNGEYNLVRLIRGKEAEALYDMIMTSGEGPNDERG